MAINIRNAKNRDALVALESVFPKREQFNVDGKGDPVTTQKLLKTDVDHDLPAILKKRKTLSAVGKALIKEDPEYTRRVEAYYYYTETMLKIDRPAEALPYFERLVKEFEKSEYLELSQKRVAELKGGIPAGK